MKYMWICNSAKPTYRVRQLMEDAGYTTRSRVFNSRKRSCWSFFTNYEGFQFAKSHNLLDPSSYHWSISSCNKQYVTNEVTGKYVGALAEVKPEEAHAWVLEDDMNWFLRSATRETTWMPVMRNPNKMVPTGESSVCLHCSSRNTERTPRPQYRPWPLHADS